ncbi:MAG: type II toxin-antitoxin system RelE/ParE family toxin [Anaerolineae bacterium]|nr:type II toxin-antitoxin system RelE/ParE family toxin [Anaerolineae bacterium]
MTVSDKPLLILHGEIKTPPMSREARVEAGYLLRQLQEGVLLSLPHSRPMPSIGNRCHELRIPDENVTWRIIYRNDADEIVILEVFAKKTDKTPHKVIETCKRRLQLYDA